MEACGAGVLCGDQLIRCGLSDYSGCISRELITVTMTIASVVALGSSLIAPVIIKKAGSKNAGIVALVFYTVGALLPRFMPPSVTMFGVGFVLIYFGMSLNACAGPIQFVN